MSTPARKLQFAVSAIRLIPHVFIWKAHASGDDYLSEDLKRWTEIYFPGETPGIKAFVKLMTRFPEFRNLFYYRMGAWAKLFSILCPPMPTLYITTPKIGPGLFIQHGFATIITAREIGRHCWINQQVTIGFTNDTDCPTIGDNVTIGAGAKVIGAVHVGDNTKVGANAVVVRDTPPNSTVVGVPAQVVKRNGRRVNLHLKAT